jgi:hypothetical protein
MSLLTKPTTLQILEEQANRAQTGEAIDDLSTAILISLWKGAITIQQAEELRLLCEMKLQMRR